jgi:hypothetical protein
MFTYMNTGSYLCMGDYRSEHCLGCGHHHWSGNMGVNCPMCNYPDRGCSREEDDEEIEDLFRDNFDKPNWHPSDGF